MSTGKLIEEYVRVETLLNGCGVLGKTIEDKVKFLIDQRDTAWKLRNIANHKLETIKDIIANDIDL